MRVNNMIVIIIIIVFTRSLYLKIRPRVHSESILHIFFLICSVGASKAEFAWWALLKFNEAPCQDIMAPRI